MGFDHLCDYFHPWDFSNVFSPLFFLFYFSHYTKAYLRLHHFWSGLSIGMSQSFDRVHPIIEWELTIYHLINCINSIPRVLSKPLVTPSHPKLPPTIQKGISNCYQNKMWIIVFDIQWTINLHPIGKFYKLDDWIVCDNWVNCI
jgi:hypothetical protein